MKKWQFSQELATNGYAVVNVPAAIDYFHDKAAVAGRDWICSICKGVIKKGQPFLRTAFGDEYRQEQVHTCWKCAVGEELTEALPYSKIGGVKLL